MSRKIKLSTKTKMRNYTVRLPESIILTLKKEALKQSEKTGQFVSAQSIIETAIKQALKGA